MDATQPPAVDPVPANPPTPGPKGTTDSNKLPLDRRWKVAWLIAAVLGATGPIVWGFFGSDPGSLEAMLLLVMAPALLLFAAWTAPTDADPPHWAIVWAGPVLEFWKLLCLGIYYLKVAFLVFAYAAATLDVVLLVVVLWFVRRAILNSKTQSAIRSGLFAVLCGVLALFMHVTYSCTFALAFHDRESRQSGKGEALHYTGDDREEVATFSFEAGETQIDETLKIVSDLEKEWPSAEEDRRKLIKGAVDKLVRPDLPRAVADQKREEIYQELMTNIDEWKKLNERLSTIDVPKEKHLWRVRVVGHANDKISLNSKDADRKVADWVNYSFSSDRADNIYRQLRNAMTKNQIRTDWELSAVSNEDQRMKGRFPLSHEHKLCVQVFVEESAGSLSLLDYLYFTVYTISTTGYGDLVPRTPLAKFITSIANLFEVLFLVVIINLVFSYRGKDHESP